MDTFCVTYQHVDCVNTVFKYRFNGKSTAMSGNVLDKVQKAIFFNQRIRGVDKMPIIAKKWLLRKKFEQHFISALRKNKSTQTTGSVFTERIDKAKKTKFEAALKKTKDCFLDGHGNNDSILVSFRIKTL